MSIRVRARRIAPAAADLGCPDLGAESSAAAESASVHLERTTEFAAQMAALCTRKPTFHNLDVLEQFDG